MSQLIEGEHEGGYVYSAFTYIIEVNGIHVKNEGSHTISVA